MPKSQLTLWSLHRYTRQTSLNGPTLSPCCDGPHHRHPKIFDRIRLWDFCSVPGHRDYTGFMRRFLLELSSKALPKSMESGEALLGWWTLASPFRDPEFCLDFVLCALPVLWRRISRS